MRIRIGISACLLGQEVRFDGGHKRDQFLTEVLAPYVEWIPVCPEVEVGMGTPREPLRLVRDDGTIRMKTTRTDVDHTDAMNRWARDRVAELARDNLCGYVLKKDSPSCGMGRVKVFGSGEMPELSGRGLYARVLMDRFPALPVEEEGRLLDPRLRENFIERVFAFGRLRDLFTGRWTAGDLVKFHAGHRMTLLAHSATGYRRLGSLIGEARRLSRPELRRRYEQQFMDTLREIATIRRHANVLTHMAGLLRRKLDEESKRELSRSIDEYSRGLVPLVVPLTLVRHHVRVHRIAYLAGQTYLEPDPRELMLRNHV